MAGKVPEEVAMTGEMSLKLRNEEIRLATAEEITRRKAQLPAPEATTAAGPWD